MTLNGHHHLASRGALTEARPGQVWRILRPARLVAEAGLAIEMGADASDLGLTIHAHPTLSESLGMAAEMYEGTITDLIAPKKKH